MTRHSHRSALRAVAGVAAAAGAILALADAGEARMLRDDCFTEIVAACNQNRDVDAAHRCVLHETNSCEALKPLRPQLQLLGKPGPEVLQTLYAADEAAPQEQAGAAAQDDAGGRQSQR